LDPTSAAAGAIDNVVYSNVFEGLTRFMGDGSVVAGLAKSWEISADGLRYTFHLQTGVTFHDGSLMTADDVKFSLDRARTEDSTNAQKALFTSIADVEVVDPHTVVISLEVPNGNLLFNLAWGDAVIVAPETIDGIKSNPVGTGAVTFVNWVQGDKIELARNPNYWGAAPALEAATFKFISDPTAAFAAMMAEDIDAFQSFPAPENLPQFDADPRFKLLIGSTEGETILSTNNKMPPFDNKLVRQALAHAIDRQAIIDGAMFGYGTPIGSHFAPHNPAYIDLTGNSNYDPAKAKALLAKAGFADGFATTLKLPPPSYARPDYYFQYDNPIFQDLMTRLTVTSDPAQRTAMLQEAQTVISQEYVNGYLFQLAATSVAKIGVQGMWLNAPTQAIDLTGISWAD
jgi:peptide/nickel transport system substrate-binding protein